MATTSSDDRPVRGEESRRIRSPWRTLKWLGGSVIVALAGWTAVELAQFGFDRYLRDPPPPPIEEQLRRVLVEAAEDGYRATTNRELDFDGDGSMSRLIILRTIEPARRTEASADELRIYDIEGSRLKLTFRFRPLTEDSKSTAWPHVDQPPTFALQLTDAGDFDGNGTSEALLQLIDDVFGLGNLVRPLMLVWDFDKLRYSVIPILSPTTTGRRGPKLARKDVFLYRFPWPIINAHTRSRFVTFGVGAFAVRGSQEGPLFAAAFDLTSPHLIDKDKALHQVRIWRLYPDGLGPLTVRCSMLGGELATASLRSLLKRAPTTGSLQSAGIRNAIDRVFDRPRVC
jgi:hypothetical protein